MDRPSRARAGPSVPQSRLLAGRESSDEKKIDDKSAYARVSLQVP